MDIKTFKNKYENKKIKEYPNQVLEKPLVSVCIITYNHARYIKDCLDGVLMQKVDFPIEILLGDDASTDGTREICVEYAKQHSDKIRLFLHHRANNISVNGNPTGRFNILYDYYSAHGKYVAMCEGDDYWTDPLKLQKQVDILDKNPEIGIVHTKYRIENEAQATTEIHERRVFDKKLSPFENYVIKADMRTLTVMFRSKFLPDIYTLFETDFMKLSPIGDRPTFLTIAAKSGIAYIDEVTGVYRRTNSVSAMRHESLKKRFEISKSVIETNLALFAYLSIKNDLAQNTREKSLKRVRLTLFLLSIPFSGLLWEFYQNQKRRIRGEHDTSYY